MGCCCCRRSKEYQALEAEIEHLITQKRLLEAKLPKKNEANTESNTPTLFPEVYKFIDYDQYSSIKVIENLYTLVSGDITVLQSLNQKFQNLSNLKDSEKLINYGSLRTEETELQKKLVSTCNDCLKELIEISNSNYFDLEKRIEKVENLLKTSNFASEIRLDISEKFKSIDQISKKCLPDVISDLKLLGEIEKALNKVEYRLPRVILDEDFILKSNQIEKNLASLIKSSLSALSSIESVFGSIEIPQKLDPVSLKSSEIDFQTYDSLFDSINSQLSSLQQLEDLKLSSIDSTKIKEKLKEIDQMLTKQFINSEKTKDAACSRLNRISRGGTSVNFLKSSLFLHIDESKRTVIESVFVLKSKAEKYIKTLETQDALFLELTEKFNQVDCIIDDIELKFHEYLTIEVKDLHKSANLLENSLRELLDETNEKLIQYQEEAQKDLIERLNYLKGKIDLTENLEKIRSFVRESNSKEIYRVRNEVQERINELQTKVDSLENEKTLISDAFNASKSQLGVTAEMAEGLMKTLNEKEIAVSDLKNNIATLQKEIEQISEDKDRIQDELDDVQKELRESKRNLRSKEHEIEELQESLSKYS